MYSFFVKRTVNKKTMGLIHSASNNHTYIMKEVATPDSSIKGITIDKEKSKEPKIESKMGPALFSLYSLSKDIEYPTSNSIVKTEDSYKSEVFSSELYESCVLSFSIVEIMENISVGLSNKDKYYGINFQKNKCSIILNDAIESDVDTLPDDTGFDYEFDCEIGDIFKIIHLSNEINIFKNEFRIYTSEKKERENDSYRALFTLSNKEDEIRNIQFYYIDQNKSALKQGPNIILNGSISNDIEISRGDRFYLLGGVSSVISGISKGKNGQKITMINNSGNNQTFLDNDTGSSFENRLYLGSNKIELKHNASINFLYVFDFKKWVLI